jgi:hypothetical protein
MKRLILITMLLMSGAVAAQADTSVWTAKQPRSDADLAAAGQFCDYRVGHDVNGVPTTSAYKKCMLSRGWIYQRTERNDTWVNHHGLTCHSILNGFGSECSNF